MHSVVLFALVAGLVNGFCVSLASRVWSGDSTTGTDATRLIASIENERTRMIVAAIWGGVSGLLLGGLIGYQWHSPETHRGIVLGAVIGATVAIFLRSLSGFSNLALVGSLVAGFLRV